MATQTWVPDDQEAVLLDYVERLARFRERRRAVQIRLSQLAPFHRLEHHQRAARAAIEPVVKKFDGALFTLTSGDLMLLTRDASIADIDEAITRLRALFGADPLLAKIGNGEDRFCVWYDIEHDYNRLLATVKALMAARRSERPTGLPTAAAVKAAAVKAAGRTALDPRQLYEVERVVATADLSSLIRRQPVVFLAQGIPAQILFHEYYVSIPDLRDTVLPGFDLVADRWLFQHLTATLDARMLAHFTRGDAAMGPKFSLNLTLRTVLSPAFLDFDAQLRLRSGTGMTVELQLLDIVAQMSECRFARELLKNRGHHLCLDGLDAFSFLTIDHQRLGMDLIKLRWETGLAEALASGHAEDLRQAVSTFGRDRVILCRCDSDRALAFGESLGITIFQGRHVDSLIATRPAA